MNLVRLALRRPLTIVVGLIAVALGAWIALQRMTRDVFPPLGIPTIYVAQPFGGMDPAQMEGYLTYFYEYHFLYITGIEHVESKSIQGASIMKLQFHPNVDMSSALSEVVAYVNRSRAFMPPGTPGPFITRFDAGSVPVGYLVFSTTNANRTVGEMQNAALNQVRPLFAPLPGVSAPPPFGGSARTILVNLKPDRLRSYGISADEVVTAMAAANTLSPSGNLPLGDKYPFVPINAVVKNIQDLAAVPIRTGTGAGGGAVFVRDLGDVADGADLITSYALANGKRTVYMPVTKRSDASTLSVVELVKKNIPEFKKVLPDDIEVTYEFDQSPYVVRAIRDLVKEGALGAVLTGLMVLLFLRDWRSAFIVVINIPVSLLAGTFALWVSGQNINLMTLGGLALAVGILVDEATVAIENIHVHLARRGSSRRKEAPSEGGTGSQSLVTSAATPSLGRAVLDATVETTGPRFLAMLCVLAVFIPAFFMQGAAKALFTPLALAVGFSMVASFVLSSTLVPVLSVWLLRGHESEVHESGFFASMTRAYGAFVKPLLAARWLVVPIYLAVALGGLWLLAPRLGTEIFPKVDAGQIQLRLRATPGTQLEKTEAIALRVLDLIKREAGPDNVQMSIGLVGVHAANYPVNLIHQWNAGPEEGVLQIQFKPGSVRTEPLKEKLRAVFKAELPDVLVSFEPSDIVERVMSFGAPTPIEIAVQGQSLPASKEFADKLRERLAKIPSLRDLQFAQVLDYPTLDVNINRERAGLLGVRMSDATKSLVASTASSRFTVPNYWADPGSGIAFSVQVQVPQGRVNSVEEFKNTPVTTTGGKATLLRNIATVSEGTAPQTYERYNLVRVVSLTANIHGSDLGSVAKAIHAAIKEAGAPPPRTSVAVRGQIPPMEEMFAGLRNGLLLAIVVIFLLLAANFQSIRLSLVVISTVPAVIAGVALTLWLTHTTLNIQSFMGAIMAVGVAVANAILLVTFAERARVTGSADATTASLEGATSRLRPILMTSFAMMAGMLPLALGTGEGGDQTAPLGRAVIGGLAAATLTTLFVLPSIFAVVMTGKHTRSASLDPDDEQSPQFTAAK
ncbi:MAG: acriflavin resistance protein [Limisphaerales bacterium]|nr:MAG: acriflavin resistance protein [Limisphaerales bacterium]KAG0506693.1 MAG: acriflavin resistance protein [Limisphaerales bacterium]TXT47672.1 MAG: acriflavin resistance protein [Limisphaerales bacterium]